MFSRELGEKTCPSKVILLRGPGGGAVSNGGGAASKVAAVRKEAGAGAAAVRSVNVCHGCVVGVTEGSVEGVDDVEASAGVTSENSSVLAGERAGQGAEGDDFEEHFSRKKK
eukprot:CAMPEP_0179429270 /NCGR_PEP_ID=MMETSP0799-20121207/14695_1 /TAXON_ID=46947 /ORGANISM="Geminigera cryophila, Strain CCMP2564" /LENGTH=111 /DNA_ID=CAMNT_0021205103 /DNA_START=381 /DNA_END=714 /DNA_ORIENTATION=+